MKAGRKGSDQIGCVITIHTQILTDASGCGNTRRRNAGLLSNQINNAF